MSQFITLSSVFSPFWAWEEYEHVFAVIGIGVFAVIVAALFFAFKKKKGFMTTREIAVCAVCIALSLGLSAIKLWPMPRGGSISPAAVVPLALFAFYFGLKKGLFAGFTFSFLKLTLGAYIVHPIQLLMDYTIPYTLIGVVALFRKMKTPGLLVGIGVFSILQFLSSFLSGIVFFYSFAENGTTAAILAYSAGYNSFQLVDGAIAIAAAFLLTCSTQFHILAKALSENPRTKAVVKPQDETQSEPAAKGSANETAAAAPVEKDLN